MRKIFDLLYRAISITLASLLLTGCAATQQDRILYSNPSGLEYTIYHHADDRTIEILVGAEAITLPQASFTDVVCERPSPVNDVIDFVRSGLVQLGIGIYLGSN